MLGIDLPNGRGTQSESIAGYHWDTPIQEFDSDMYARSLWGPACYHPRCTMPTGVWLFGLPDCEREIVVQ